MYHSMRSGLRERGNSDLYICTETPFCKILGRRPNVVSVTRVVNRICSCQRTDHKAHHARSESEEKRSEIGQVVDSDIRFAVERSQCTWLAASDRSPRAVSFLRKLRYSSALLSSSLSSFLFLSFYRDLREKNAVRWGINDRQSSRLRVTLCACCRTLHKCNFFSFLIYRILV